jgi:arylsulfatase A-like enzyme
MSDLNVICICLDTFRADLVYPEDALCAEAQTPNLDAFRQDALWFRQAFGEGQPTLQMRRGCFTGRRSYPWRYNFDRRGHWHHAFGWHKIPPDQDTLAEMLLDRGYRTGLVADTYHMFKPTMNYARGFLSYDFVRGQENDNWKSGPISLIREQALKHVPDLDNPFGRNTLIQYLLNQRGRETEEDYQAARVFRSAMDWVDDNGDDGPFFLWIDSFDPHEPWDPPPGYADRYCPDYEGLEHIMHPPRKAMANVSDKVKERIRALYLGEATFVDRWVGTFLDRLKSKGLYDSSLIFVISDHGTQLLDHGAFGKNAVDLHPFNTRLTWMMRHPDAEKGKPVDGFVQNHDLAPTILDYLGLAPPPMDGRSFRPLAEGDASAARDHVVTGWAGFGQGGDSGASVRDNEWNAIFNVGRPEVPPRLYDLKADIEERNNVAEDRPEILEHAQKRLEAVLGSPLPFSFREASDPTGVAPAAAFLQARKRRGMSV